jgi:hypothetical protein
MIRFMAVLSWLAGFGFIVKYFSFACSTIAFLVKHFAFCQIFRLFRFQVQSPEKRASRLLAGSDPSSLLPIDRRTPIPDRQNGKYQEIGSRGVNP